MQIIYIITILIFVFNIPFGIWRFKCRKFDLNWFLSIHIPIPFIILARFYFKIPYSWFSFILFVIAFFLGQILGKMLGKKYY